MQVSSASKQWRWLAAAPLGWAARTLPQPIFFSRRVLRCPKLCDQRRGVTPLVHKRSRVSGLLAYAQSPGETACGTHPGKKGAVASMTVLAQRLSSTCIIALLVVGCWLLAAAAVAVAIRSSLFYQDIGTRVGDQENAQEQF